MRYRFPTEILIGLNDRDEKLHDVYKVNITTGERTLVEKNEQGFTGYTIDEDYKIRFATRFSQDGGNELLQPDGKGGWKDFQEIPMSDTLTTGLAGFDKSGDTVYIMDSRGRNTGALFALNLKTNETKLVAENPLPDVGGVLSHPTENRSKRLVHLRSYQVGNPQRHGSRRKMRVGGGT